MAANIHIADVGTNIVVTVKNQDGGIVNLSTFTSITLLIKKPDGTILERECFFVTNGSDGKVQYVSVLNDFTQPGNHKFQVRCVSPTGTWHSNILTKKVYSNVAN